MGSDPNLYDKHFVLMADIDLDPNRPGGRVFDRAVVAASRSDVGYAGTAFSGSFDGALHTISNLTIVVQSQSTYVSHLGLFGCVAAEGRVSRLRVVNARISQSHGLMNSGLLCGENQGIIRDCGAAGAISYSNHSRGVGGLAGSNNGFVFGSTAEARLFYVPWAAVQQLSVASADASPVIVMRGGGTGAYAAAPQSLGPWSGSTPA